MSELSTLLSAGPDPVPFHATPSNRRQSASPFQPGSQRRLVSRKSKGNRILMFGRIRELALYRAAVLRDRGFEVSTPHTHEDAVSAVRRGNFDTVVLSYTLLSDEVKELAQLVREYCPECPIVAIVADPRRLDREIGPDAMVNADDGPEALLAVLRRITPP